MDVHSLYDKTKRNLSQQCGEIAQRAANNGRISLRGRCCGGDVEDAMRTHKHEL